MLLFAAAEIYDDQSLKALVLSQKESFFISFER